MRLCAFALLGLSGCSLFGLGGVDSAVVTEVRVESLDLTQPWDSPLTRDLPDVYVDLRSNAAGLSGLTPLWRSDVVDDLERLPQVYRPVEGVIVRLGDEVLFNVADRDAVGDDQMFTTDAFRFEDRYDGQARGDTERLVFENAQGRIAVAVRWE